MNHDYKDIRERIALDPLWWDEHAVPRYCEFTPRVIANIYADEAVLMVIACQACEREFAVCMSAGLRERALAAVRGDDAYQSLEALVRQGAIHYGDPPNVRCCPAGPTMNSDPLRVLEFWKRREVQYGWQRVPALEIAIALPDSEP